ncbi:hypothetical protein BH09BAC2_BH09BAC2_16150 [soil metagenome]
MNKSGIIIVIEDDIDDQEFLQESFEEINCPNKIMYFPDGEAALDYLISCDEEPFLILSDINMPKLNGMELHAKIQNNEQLRLRCIPYLFFTTTSDQRQVIDAYSKSVQGFFIKPSSIVKLKDILQTILKYWTDCESPNYIK